ncbi:YbaB/EbfC family nucleoid-associated protein [Metallumcola ferriviriculae]|uniref:Nucleoid-associated protein MFMK1_000304 n=1 Tax=Metallumcola ferriviriculae TaxID=3039180 RepID=A0AAU0UHZ1_9FIRM|nr:YbaB/EbfC family nucleoid-associated protein [Desulfitibacteraceae bacterium MK1]
MGFGNMGKMMKQAQAMQKKMAKLQEEMAEKEVTASTGGGAVTVTVNGKQEVLSVKIEKDVVDPEDVEMLQDLVLSAVNEAMNKAQEMMSEEMNKITGGMNIPGLV